MKDTEKQMNTCSVDDKYSDIMEKRTLGPQMGTYLNCVSDCDM